MKRLAGLSLLLRILISAVVVTALRSHAVAGEQGPNVVHQIQFFGVLILGVASILVFYGAVATHFANKSQEDDQC